MSGRLRVESKLLAIVGPTGTGKSELSLQVALELRADGVECEIISADSMQLYRGMDIGTAKLPVGARRGIPHHMLDVLDVTQEASVAAYQKHALETIVRIQEAGALPILVGGSGLYISSVLFDLEFPGTDPEIRQRYEALLEEWGTKQLYRLLTKRDPDAAQAIGPHNARRLVRALEVGELTGRPYRAVLPDASQNDYKLVIGLRAPSEWLYPHLDARVEQMWADGLVDEVAALVPLGIDDSITASRAIGYAQALAELRGKSTRAEAVEVAQALTRKYARRQKSWFGRYDGVHWFDVTQPGLEGQALTTVRAWLAH